MQNKKVHRKEEENRFPNGNWKIWNKLIGSTIKQATIETLKLTFTQTFSRIFNKQILWQKKMKVENLITSSFRKMQWMEKTFTKHSRLNSENHQTFWLKQVTNSFMTHMKCFNIQILWYLKAICIHLPVFKIHWSKKHLLPKTIRSLRMKTIRIWI